MEGNSVATLIDIIFGSNTAYSSSGNIFSTSTAATLDLSGMANPSQMVGVEPNTIPGSSCSDKNTVSYCNTTSGIPFSEYYHENDKLCITDNNLPRCGCPLGYYAKYQWLGPCLACPNGKSSLDSGAKVVSECQACSDGQFQTIVSGVLSCKVCPAGYYQKQAGQPSCTACQVGKYIDADNSTAAAHELESQCLPCDPGYEFTDITTPCQVCAGGKFQGTVTDDARPCTTCPPNTFIADQRDDSGYHDNSKDCLPCTAGTHSSAGSLFCDRCAAGTRMFENKTLNETTCVSCKSGRYQSSHGQGNIWVFFLFETLL
jgi:hypothetical protein